MRWLSFLIFFVVALLIVSGWHYYLWLRLLRDPGWSPTTTRVLTGVLIALGVSLPLGMIAARVLPPAFSRGLAWFAFLWMGGGFLLLLMVFVGDAFSFVLRRIMMMGAAGPSPEPIDVERRMAFARMLAAGTSVAATGATIYGVRGALGTVQVREVEVKLERLPRALSGMTVVQLTDIHVGALIGRTFVEGLVKQVQALRPDVLVITGDLVDGTVERLGAAVAPLARIEARWGRFFVTGNHEYYSGVDPWLRFLSRQGFGILENRRVEIGELRGPSIDLIGIPDPTARRMGRAPPDLAKAMAGCDPMRESLLLAHQPRAIDEAAAAGVGLLLSGHTHGGQIWPFGALVALTQPYLAGLHRRADTQIYVSRGTGYWGPPMRIGAPAEITRVILLPG